MEKTLFEYVKRQGYSKLQLFLLIYVVAIGVATWFVTNNPASVDIYDNVAKITFAGCAVIFGGLLWLVISQAWGKD